MTRLHPNLQTLLSIAAIFAVFVFAQWLDAPSDMAAEDATAASLRDALAQAQQERPELWTAERKARADRAVGLVAKGVQP